MPVGIVPIKGDYGTRTLGQVRQQHCASRTVAFQAVLDQWVRARTKNAMRFVKYFDLTWFQANCGGLEKDLVAIDDRHFYLIVGLIQYQES